MFSRPTTRERLLLVAGFAMPWLYFLALVLAGATYPDFDHGAQLPSELGADNAPYAFGTAFNAALIAVGITGICGAAGIATACRALYVKTRWWLPWCLSAVLPSISLLQSGLFPLPSPWHASFPLLVAGVLFPALGAVILRQLHASVAAIRYLGLSFAACLVVIGGILSGSSIVTEDNVGWWIRAWAVAAFPPFAVVCWALLQHRSRWF